jgi:outer membrane protein TolC
MAALVDAQTALTSAETELARAVLDWRVASAELNHALGRPLLSRLQSAEDELPGTPRPEEVRRQRR